MSGSETTVGKRAAGVPDAAGSFVAETGIFPDTPRRLLAIFGTRPEGIKLAPLILALRDDPLFRVEACTTGQHRELLDGVLHTFGIAPDYDLHTMARAQNSSDIAGRILLGLPSVFATAKPNLVIVQGDTTSAFAGALSAYYHRVPIAHVEAGLRASGPGAPWPEEGNRRLISKLASIHLAPTMLARDRLLAEGVRPTTIHLTGNTVVDALAIARNRIASDVNLREEMARRFAFLSPDRRLILATLHRRESFGQDLEMICAAIADVAAARADCEFVLPVHPNPAVDVPVRKALSRIANVHLLDPLGYLPFVHLIGRAYLLLTDSGGVQEEAASLGRPTLVMRSATERPEGIEAGTLKLVGTSREGIRGEVLRLLDDEHEYRRMSVAGSPFGDGAAAQRIAAVLRGLS